MPVKFTTFSGTYSVYCLNQNVCIHRSVPYFKHTEQSNEVERRKANNYSIGVEQSVTALKWLCKLTFFFQQKMYFMKNLLFELKINCWKL